MTARMWAGLVLMAPLLAVSATAGPCLTTLAPERDFSVVHTQVEQWPTDAELAALADAVDADDDGQITADEVAAFEASTHRQAETWPPLRLDGREPTSVEQWTNITGAEGPAADRSKWVVMVQRLHRFDVVEDVRHTVEGEGPAGGEPGAVAFTAPPAWWVEKVNGTRHHRPEYRHAEFDACAPFRIDFVEISAVPDDQSHETGTGEATPADGPQDTGTGLRDNGPDAVGTEAAAMPLAGALVVVALAAARRR